MLDQDTARALLTIADETGANLAFLGDRHQLPAVGRGGVLDLATRIAGQFDCLTLDTVHRFTDPAYADLTRLMRTGERSGDTFDALLARGQIVIHACEAERTQALVAASTEPDHPLIIATTRDQVSDLNAAIRDHRQAAGQVRPSALTTSRGEPLSVGDRVATRRNDPDLGVANRDTWTVLVINDDGGLVIGQDGERHGERFGEQSGERTLPPAYVREHVQLAYASTVYGAQGETVRAAHLLLGDGTGAASAYVGMTRGRDRNVAHLVAESAPDARRAWIDVFSRDRADLGPRHAARLAAQDIDRYGNQPAIRPNPGHALHAAVLRASIDATRVGRRPRPEDQPRSTSPPGNGIGR